jgi:magnesium-protoporphyrin O-methyltransferase
MNGCQCKGVEMMFNQKSAVRELKQYRRKGPNRTTQMLIDALKTEGIEGMTLLDIGGGVGAIQHELLSAGVRSAANVDASAAYVAVAKEEAERRGHAGLVSYYHGDFIQLAPEIAPADIVTLDRVICCYDDMQALVGLSSARARNMYGLVYPRDTWWMKIRVAIENFVYRLVRNPFRSFVHPTEQVDAVVRSSGLRRRLYLKTFLWQVVVYAR